LVLVFLAKCGMGQCATIGATIRIVCQARHFNANDLTGAFLCHASTRVVEQSQAELASFFTLARQFPFFRSDTARIFARRVAVRDTRARTGGRRPSAVRPRHP
jgi:hypothetical protein